MNRTARSMTNSAGEEGQVLVIATALLGALAISALFFLSIQRAYNLANFLDETAELVAQAAARPEGDTIIDGTLSIDPVEARKAGKAAKGDPRGARPERHRFVEKSAGNR